MRYLIAAALLTLSALGVSAKDKYDEANFPLLAHVVASDTETIQTGARDVTNPACVNTGENQILKAYCAQSGHHIENTSVDRSIVTVQIENATYRVRGRTILMPGNYRAKKTKDGFEILARKNNGKLQSAKYRILSVA